MIRHTVVFKFIPDADSPRIATFFEEVKKLTTIPGVEHFECLRQVSKKNKFEFGLSMEFANRELYDNYNTHPVHTNFVSEYWLKDVEDFLEIDYEPLD